MITPYGCTIVSTLYTSAMNTFIGGITQQLDFPRRDLSDDNAQMLEVMLSNPHVLNIFHETAESVNAVYRVGHPIVKITIEQLYDSQHAWAASVGTAVYEAIAALVQKPTTDISPVMLEHLQSPDSTEALVYTLQSELQAFYRDMPNTAAVVESASSRVTADTTYAVLGAVVTRNFELVDANYQ